MSNFKKDASKKKMNKTLSNGDQSNSASASPAGSVTPKSLADLLPPTPSSEFERPKSAPVPSVKKTNFTSISKPSKDKPAPSAPAKTPEPPKAAEPSPAPVASPPPAATPTPPAATPAPPAATPVPPVTPTPSGAAPTPVMQTASAVHQEAVNEMEVLAPVTQKQELSTGVQTTAAAIPKWAFWKRPSKRDQQLAQISNSYVEMVDLIRAVKGQMDSQHHNNVILRDSLAHLPDAMEGMKNFGESQKVVGDSLREIHGQMVQAGEKDQQLAESMDGVNLTLRGIDGTNQATMKTFERVQDRMKDSDDRMESLFGNVKESEEKVTNTMVSMQRNMAIMQGLFLLCLIVVIGILVFFVLDSRKDDKTPPVAPAQPVATESGTSLPSRGN